jgi:PRTRC genetic system ThiF family protein
MNINPHDIDTIHLLGCGGTGCHVAAGLARLEVAIRALGGDFPDVVLIDHDRVDTPNVGRQLFTNEEVGQFKSTALCHRMNMAYGLNWTADTQDGHDRLNLICVDSREARKRIYADATSFYSEDNMPLYIDFGNTADTGQVILGGGGLNLPSEYCPDLINTELPSDNKPSCSLAEALEHQELFVNQFVATYGLQILWQIFRRGEVSNRGTYINLAGLSVPINI